MEFLDGWAVTIGNASCRYFSRNGHDGLEGLFCGDGASAAGWKLTVAALAAAILAYVLARMLRPSP